MSTPKPQVYRVMLSEAVKTVVTTSPFVVMKLDPKWYTGWRCVGTGTQEQCEESVAWSAIGKTLRWTDIPYGAQCVIR